VKTSQLTSRKHAKIRANPQDSVGSVDAIHVPSIALESLLDQQTPLNWVPGIGRMGP
jgi:hypothetical protein